MVMWKMANSEVIFKYDCSDAYGNLGVPFFLRDTRQQGEGLPYENDGGTLRVGNQFEKTPKSYQDLVLRGLKMFHR